jgi:hypothetical protein
MYRMNIPMQCLCRCPKKNTISKVIIQVNRLYEDQSRESKSQVTMGVWRGVANGQCPWTPQSIAKARHVLPLYAMQAATLKQPCSRFRGGHPQGERPAAVFFSLGYSTPYASARDQSRVSNVCAPINCYFQSHVTIAKSRDMYHVTCLT